MHLLYTKVTDDRHKYFNKLENVIAYMQRAKGRIL